MPPAPSAHRRAACGGHSAKRLDGGSWGRRRDRDQLFRWPRWPPGATPDHPHPQTTPLAPSSAPGAPPATPARSPAGTARRRSPVAAPASPPALRPDPPLPGHRHSGARVAGSPASAVAARPAATDRPHSQPRRTTGSHRTRRHRRTTEIRHRRHRGPCGECSCASGPPAHHPTLRTDRPVFAEWRRLKQTHMRTG